MALEVSRKEFLGVGQLEIPDPEVVAAKMVLDFEAEVFRRMKSMGVRQKDLAEMMGVTPATVSKTLSETSNMTFKTAARIAHALGCLLVAPTLREFDESEYDAAHGSESEADIAPEPSHTNFRKNANHVGGAECDLLPADAIFPATLHAL